MKNDPERLAVLETKMEAIDTKINSIENSVQSLHGKFDSFVKILTENYVAKDTFEEYKKSKWLERISLILITAVITALVGYFFKK